MWKETGTNREVQPKIQDNPYIDYIETGGTSFREKDCVTLVSYF